MHVILLISKESMEEQTISHGPIQLINFVFRLEERMKVFSDIERRWRRSPTRKMFVTFKKGSPLRQKKNIEQTLIPR